VVLLTALSLFKTRTLKVCAQVSLQDVHCDLLSSLVAFLYVIYGVK
jgi:hypothetical protein